MNRTGKIVLPLIITALIALAGSYLRTEGQCSCNTPFILFGSILGCTSPSSGESAQEPGGQQQIDPANKGNPLLIISHDKQSGPAKVTFIELGSVNCIPCKMMQPVMDQVEKKYPGQVKVVFYDVWTDQGQKYGKIFGIRAIPTQVFLDEKGIEYFRHIGFFPFEEVEKILRRKGVQ